MTGRGHWWKTLVSRQGRSKLDIEFPTNAPSPWKSQKARFPHSHSPDDGFPFLNQKEKTTPRALRALGLAGALFTKGAVLPHRATRPFQDHLVLESNVDFSIIFRLENAKNPTEP
jgi:hypothetical protein